MSGGGEREGGPGKPGEPGSDAGGGPAEPAAEPAETGGTGRRFARVLEGAMADAVRRGLEAGWDRLGGGERTAALRSAIGDLKMPREIAGYVVSQLDETKSAILRVVAQELREFLESSHFGEELSKLLTSLTFEITTTVRFVPNDEGRVPKPKVRSNLHVHSQPRGGRKSPA